MKLSMDATNNYATIKIKEFLINSFNEKTRNSYLEFLKARKSFFIMGLISIYLVLNWYVLPSSFLYVHGIKSGKIRNLNEDFPIK